MSKKHKGASERNECCHTETIDDDRVGECICLQCGLVVETIYQNQKSGISFFIDPKLNTEVIHCFLQDVGAHGQICQSLLQYTEWYYQKIKYQLTKNGAKSIFKDKELASYALYETLCRHEAPHTIPEIEFYTNTKAKTLFAIESALNIRETLNHPLHYVSRFCAMLNLNFWDEKIIRGIVFNMFGLGNVRPQCVVAVVIYLYCKEKDILIPLKKICEICVVSSTNIYKLSRGLQEPYLSKISLLYT